MRIYKTRADFTKLQAAQNPSIFAGTICTITDEALNPMYVFQGGVWNSTVTATTNPLTGMLEFSDESLNSSIARKPSAGYFCHLWAGSSSNGDALVPDISGAQNHATFNTGLTKALAWATPGFASTDNAAAYRTYLLPPCNFDYAASESMIIIWKGRGNPAANKGLVANTLGAEAGFCLRAQADGRIQPYISDGVGVFLNTSVNVMLEPSITHSYAFIIDGVNRTHAVVEDGVLTRTMSAIGTGAAYDTRASLPLKLGTQDSFSTTTNTVVCSTQALVVLRGRVGKGLPADWLELVKAIQRSPDRLVTNQQW